MDAGLMLKEDLNTLGFSKKALAAAETSFLKKTKDETPRKGGGERGRRGGFIGGLTTKQNIEEGENK